ncbi:MAG: type III-A CRISPR-associated RAMP protein Csm3 [Candidatus Omnitrophica bacterium 4484_70.1]|nr:MAG: type III-A CRISPR-associated RAMP protein Csm3 [Candidatus Omnitrophica bacterium 4484_70.1]
MRLKEYVSLEAILKLKSGLHIGAATTKEIGKGEPLPVMKSLINGLPYIPGSSLKGKMRCLFEMVYGKTSNGGPCECGKCQICLLFGSGNAKTTFEPSRLIFRDIYLTKKSAETIEKLGLETKPGVSIDRNTGKARGHALFPIERIPAESEFDFIISCRIFESDDKESIRKWLGVGLYLLELDALGGGGTRGSGYIEFVNIVFDGQPFNENWREEAKSIKDSLLEQVKIKKI